MLPTAKNAPAPPQRGLTKMLFAALALVSIVGPWAATQMRNRAAAASAPLPGQAIPVGPCTLWFIGSSTIARWGELAEEMQPWVPTNRGVPAALMPEINHRLAQQPAGARPRAIILYAGDNDIAAGRPVAEVLDDLRNFLAIKSRVLGPVPAILLSVKPSPARWRFRPQQIAFNNGAKAIVSRHADAWFVDVVPSMLVAGRPGPFFVEDGIHMNDVGYRLWSSKLRPALRVAIPFDTVSRCESNSGIVRP